MCFMKAPKTADPGTAPPPPEPVAEMTDPAGNRKMEDKANYGGTAPSLRVDREDPASGAGTGLRM